MFHNFFCWRLALSLISFIPLDISRKLVYTMNQQNVDVFQIISESLHTVFSSSAFRDLFLGLLGVFVFATVMHWIALLMNPFRDRHAKPSDKIAEAEAEAEATCCFRCDCEDCKSYESGKYCPRCDRFESCAYCSAREHCDL